MVRGTFAGRSSLPAHSCEISIELSGERWCRLPVLVTSPDAPWGSKSRLGVFPQPGAAEFEWHKVCDTLGKDSELVPDWPEVEGPVPGSQRDLTTPRPLLIQNGNRVVPLGPVWHR